MFLPDVPRRPGPPIITSVQIGVGARLSGIRTP
jgi:hypothetical protein